MCDYSEQDYIPLWDGDGNELYRIKNVPVIICNNIDTSVHSMNKYPRITNITSRTNMDTLNDFVVIDTETTGLKTDTHRIVNVAAVRFKNFVPVECMTTLINPGRKIPKSATKFHGITDEMVADKPYLSQVSRGFKDFIGNSPIVGHNIEFDIKHLAVGGIDLSERKHIYDTFFISENCLTASYDKKQKKKYSSDDFDDDLDFDYDVEDRKLGTLCDYFGLFFSEQHEPVTDCTAIGFLFSKFIEDIMQIDLELFPTKSSDRTDTTIEADNTTSSEVQEEPENEDTNSTVTELEVTIDEPISVVEQEEDIQLTDEANTDTAILPQVDEKDDIVSVDVEAEVKPEDIISETADEEAVTTEPALEEQEDDLLKEQVAVDIPSLFEEQSEIKPEEHIEEPESEISVDEPQTIPSPDKNTSQECKTESAITYRHTTQAQETTETVQKTASAVNDSFNPNNSDDDFDRRRKGSIVFVTALPFLILALLFYMLELTTAGTAFLVIDIFITIIMSLVVFKGDYIE